MQQVAALSLSIAMIAAFLLVLFGARLAWRGEHRRQGVLMLVAAAVILANVLVWTV